MLKIMEFTVRRVAQVLHARVRVVFEPESSGQELQIAEVPAVPYGASKKATKALGEPRSKKTVPAVTLFPFLFGGRGSKKDDVVEPRRLCRMFSRFQPHQRISP